MASAAHPMAPYRVLDLTEGGEMFCGQILADFGADVVAVEPPGGSPARRLGPFDNATGESLFWLAYARGKRSVTADVRSPGGRAAFLDLVAGADVVLESFVPGEMARLGLSYEQLAAVNPRVVLVSITPFGQHGPKARWASADLVVQAAAGVAILTGDANRPPVQVPGEQTALHAGAEAAAATLIALHARERDGLGQHVDISAQASYMLATQGFAVTAAWNDPVKLGRAGGGAQVGPFHLQYVYPCKDGHVAVTFLFGNVIGPYTHRLFSWMCEEGFVDEATRDKDWVSYFLQLLSGQEPGSELVRCTRAIEAFTLTKTKAELARAALERRLLIVPVATVEDVVNSPQLESRSFWAAVPAPARKEAVRYPGPIVRFADAAVGRWNPAPSAGQDSDQVRAEWAIPAATRAAASARTAQRRPALEGLRVIDLSWVYATPGGVRILADYGATVVHVESPSRPDTLRSAQPFKDGQPGPERSGQYASIQANKLGVSLNLSKEPGRDILRRLVAEWADVLVESFAPGTMASWGLGYHALEELNPRLVMLSSCMNGQTGPQCGLAGFGTMGGHLAGFGALTGWPDRAPAGPFTAYTDYTAPKLVAASILAAVDRQRRTGEGCYIDLSQIEVALHYLTPSLLDFTVNGRVETRRGNASDRYAPHGSYPCKGDDRWIAIACAGDAQWRSLCTVARQPAWASDTRFATFAARQENARELDATLSEWTRGQECERLEQSLQDAGVPAHRCSTSADLIADPQLIARGHWAEVRHPDLGPVIIESSRIRMSATPHLDGWPGPTFGQHNDVVLRDLLGMTDDEIATATIEGALD
jgi:crotonobetainyl-CoA:carnitine CoA-transferase CaiB-like acyl-CoA transferase